MAYVPVPKDLSGVKNKVILNLTRRQLVCFSLAAFVGIPAYLGARGLLGNSLAALLMIGLMLPFFFLAMFERDGRPAEKILISIIRAKLWPGVRPYKTENLYEYLEKEGKTTAIKNETTGAAASKKRRAGKGK